MTADVLRLGDRFDGLGIPVAMVDCTP